MSAAMIGCTSDATVTYRFEIKSDVNWSASYKPVGTGHSTELTGSGDMTIPLHDPPPVCITVQGGGEGYLQVYAYKHITNKGSIFGRDDDRDILQDSDKTADPSGDVGVCTQ